MNLARTWRVKDHVKGKIYKKVTKMA